MNLTFKLLEKQDFQILLGWLSKPHVKAWYDKEIEYTLEKVQQKYESYTKGYKLESGVKKPIYAFIVYLDTQQIGYVQYYNAYDFPRDDGIMITRLPEKLAAFDIFIGEEEYIGKGIGSEIIKKLLIDYIWKEFDACFVDVDADNVRAIKTYEKTGFITIKNMDQNIWMICKNGEDLR
ncbi:MAG: GNAT family N-acetyltransferase [Sphingobacteriia bacterium]|nr:GNAT family N-acetyltransferase [Sphingobacteriia bacterium]